MKVSELIERLQAFDPDWLVAVEKTRTGDDGQDEWEEPVLLETVAAGEILSSKPLPDGAFNNQVVVLG